MPWFTSGDCDNTAGGGIGVDSFKLWVRASLSMHLNSLRALANQRGMKNRNGSIAAGLLDMASLVDGRDCGHSISEIESDVYCKRSSARVVLL